MEVRSDLDIVLMMKDSRFVLVDILGIFSGWLDLQSLCCHVTKLERRSVGSVVLCRREEMSFVEVEREKEQGSWCERGEGGIWDEKFFQRSERRA